MADYREENRGFLTASKMKLFIDSPSLYKAIFVDEVDTSNLKKSTALTIWSMVDKFLLTRDEFENEYMFPIWRWLKDDLLNYCAYAWIQTTWKEKVDELKEMVYWNKTVLTESQTEMLASMKDEVRRQPLWDWNPTKEEYKSQVDLFWEMEWVKIKWTLDRFLYEEESWIAVIRDLKTTSSMYYNRMNDTTQFLSELIYNDPYHYKLQMAMYVYLVKQNYPNVKEIHVIIDAIWTSNPYFYQAIKMDTEELELVIETQMRKLVQDIKAFDSWATKIEATSRAKLSWNQYYRIHSDDCVQKEFDFCWVPSDTKANAVEEDFNWDDL